MDMSRWARDERILVRETPGLLAAVLAPDAGEPVVLEGTSLEVWRELARPSSVSEIAGRLADRFHADPDTVTRDVAALVDRLAAVGALRPVR